MLSHDNFLLFSHGMGSLHKLEKEDMIIRLLLLFKFTIYLSEIKTKTKHIFDFYYKHPLHKRQKKKKKKMKGENDRKANTYHIHFITLYVINHTLRLLAVGFSFSQVIAYHLRTEKALELKAFRSIPIPKEFFYMRGG